MKKVILFIFILILSGCYNYRELSDLAIVSALSIDKEEDNYIVNAQIINIIEGGKKGISEAPITVITSEGKTIFDAIRKLNLKTPKIYFGSNIEYILLSKNVIENNLDEIVDYLSRETKLPLNYLIVTTLNSQPKDILSMLSQFDINSSTNLSKIIKLSEERYGASYSLTIKDLLVDYLTKEKDIIFPSIELIGEKNSSTSDLENSDLSSFIELSSLIVFKNNKIIKLNEEERYGYNYLTNHIINVNITNKCDGGYYSLETISSNSNFKDLKDNNLTIETNIETELNYYGCSYDLNDNNSLDILKDLTKEYINNLMDKTIKLEQKEKIDFIGIGNYIYKNYNSYFDFKNNWQEEGLNKLNYNYITNIEIKKQGNLRGDIQ